jgi:hypothetical protein
VNVTTVPAPGVTVTIAPACFDVLNFDFAMIVVVPGVSAVARPEFASTEATAGFDDEYVTPRFALSLATWPMNVAV